MEFGGGTLRPQAWFAKNMIGGKLIGLTVCYDTEAPAKTGWRYCKCRAHYLAHVRQRDVTRR